MTKQKSLEDLRIKIDEIDLQILNLISDRKTLVTQVVKFKNRDQIVDENRIEEILSRLDREAKKRGVSQTLVRDLWESMIKSFISYEEKIFDANKDD
tara:strand:- start:49 stop:339 length:291 start_codon:yes stop_codon:yes gene_type:complete